MIGRYCFSSSGQRGTVLPTRHTMSQTPAFCPVSHPQHSGIHIPWAPTSLPRTAVAAAAPAKRLFTQEEGPWKQQQQQQPPRKRRSPAPGDPPGQRPRTNGRNSSRGREADPDSDDEDEFLSGPESARLRRLLKNKGRDAVVDEQGYVKVPVGEEADQKQQQLKQQRRQSNAAASTGSSSTQEGPPARPPVSGPLPIVRPNDVDKGTFFSGMSWRQLGASQEVTAALQNLGITKPSHVQAEAYKLLLSSVPAVAVADQAGSGKTLAYLLPLLQQIHAQEQQLGRQATPPGSAKVIVLTPTTELGQQVLRVVRALSAAGLRCRSALATGGQADRNARAKSFRTQAQQLADGLDLLVAAPGRLLAHLKAGNLTLDHTQVVVLDEVDVLCGGEGNYQEYIAPVKAAAPEGLRFLLVSATLPQHTYHQLQDLFPGLQAAFGPGLHRTAAGLTEELVDCSGGDEISLESGTKRKLEALGGVLARHNAPRALVFCNKLETCRTVENYLVRHSYLEEWQVLAYHEAVSEDMRKKHLKWFLLPPTPSATSSSSSSAGRNGSSSSTSSSKAVQGSAPDRSKPLVMVCTDRTSRGIDSMFCEHVVLFDFPRDPSEYVRRVGRTARGAGGKGVVSLLVLGKQVPLAQDILSRSDKGVPVHRIPDLW